MRLGTAAGGGWVAAPCTLAGFWLRWMAAATGRLLARRLACERTWCSVCIRLRCGDMASRPRDGDGDGDSACRSSTSLMAKITSRSPARPGRAAVHVAALAGDEGGEAPAGRVRPQGGPRGGGAKATWRRRWAT